MQWMKKDIMNDFKLKCLLLQLCMSGFLEAMMITVGKCIIGRELSGDVLRVVFDDGMVEYDRSTVGEFVQFLVRYGV